MDEVYNEKERQEKKKWGSKFFSNSHYLESTFSKFLEPHSSLSFVSEWTQYNFLLISFEGILIE